MKFKLARSVFVFSLILLSGCAVLKPSPKIETRAVTLKDLSPLEGVWAGKSADGKPVKAVYRKTSGGTAIVETLFPGTAHEMVSMYYVNNGAIELTHFCALGNQPVLRGGVASVNEIEFKFVGGTNITAGKGTYMSGMRLTFVDDNHIKAVWSSTKDGKPSEHTVFELARVKDCPGKVTSPCKGTTCKLSKKGKK